MCSIVAGPMNAPMNGPMNGPTAGPTGFAELHCHSTFSFLDGASASEDLVERAVALGLSSLAITDHQGLYGVVRFSTAAREAGIRPVLGVEIELVDAAVPDPGRIVVPPRRAVRRRHASATTSRLPDEGRPVRPRPVRARLPGHRDVVKEDLRGISTPQRGPHLVLLARDDAGDRCLCWLFSWAYLSGYELVPSVGYELRAEH